MHGYVWVLVYCESCVKRVAWRVEVYHGNAKSCLSRSVCIMSFSVGLNPP
jgi:hypothetical protein